MRRIFLMVAAALTLLSAASSPNQALAGTLPVPTGIQAVLGDSSVVQEAAYTCRRVWRCGDYGCGWRRVCEYTRPMYYRPYYRPYRHYHRW